MMLCSVRFSNSVIFESCFTKDFLLNNFFKYLDNSHVINIGKDEYFRPTVERINNQNNFYSRKEESFILCVSHLYPYKNILRMLDAFNLACDKTSNTKKLLIAGNQDYKEYNQLIKEKIKFLKLNDKVELLGPVKKDALRELYSKCLFLIFPSPYENFAYTLVEAMSCGAAIICSDTTAMPETCGEAAIYFDPNSTEEMAEKIVMLLENTEKKNSLKKLALTKVKQYPDYQEVSKKTLEIITTYSLGSKIHG